MRSQAFFVGSVVFGGSLGSGPALAQDLYDPTVLRTFNLTFHDANWLQLLCDNYLSETLIYADLEVDGEVYPDVGVRIRGNTSYSALPPDSQKTPRVVDAVNYTDAGTPGRFTGAVPDIGAYEADAQIPAPAACVGALTGDGVTDDFDFAIFAGDCGCSGSS